MEAEVTCPYCGESISVWVDEGGGGSQQYVEDCSVCCRPIELSVSASEDDGIFVSASRYDD
jgi:Cysteine-rich CPXCG